MIQQKFLKDEIISNNSFKQLTRAYQEHAVGQMNFAKYAVLGSRQFSKDLDDIFLNVKTSYRNILTGKKDKSAVKKNGKQAWILITANKKLYGDLLIRICKLFIENVKNCDPKKVDLIIIGSQGRDFFDSLSFNMPYKYYELSEFNVSLDFLKTVNKDLVSYDEVVVFYGKFENLLAQNPVKTSIAGDLPTSSADKTKESPESPLEKKHDFLFEPTIEEIFAFFENQVLSLLLNQIVQEAQLAKFASRIDAMEQAQQRIDKNIALLTLRERIAKNMDMNRKQLETLAGRALWAGK